MAMIINNPIEIRSGLLARNTALNFIGQVIPLFVGVVTIPFIIRGLGTDRFGILSLAWVVLGYFSLFNLGLGRATTKFVAEYLGQGQTRKLPQLVWTSIGLHIFLGTLGGLFLAVLVPLLVNRVFNITPALAGEARSTFFILAATLPIVLTAAALQGVLEAGQRFDLVNVVKIPASALLFLIPAAALPLGFNLPQIALLLLITKLGTALAYLVCSIRGFPALRQISFFDAQAMRSLFTYGGWITVSNVVSPMLEYLERFLIGALLSMTSVAYYASPYEVITRLRILPISLASTLFPAFSTLGATDAYGNLERLYARSIKYLLLIMGPMVLILVLFAQEILRLWLGGDFAEKSTLVLQILAIGVLVNSLALIPSSLIQGFGRPDITARFHLLELPIYLVLALLLVRGMGIAGAALAWSLRIGLDALLLFGASWKLFSFPLSGFVQNGVLRGVVALLMLAGTLLMVPLLGEAVLTRVAIATTLVAVFALAGWHYVLDMTDRKTLVSAVSQLAGVTGGAR